LRNVGCIINDALRNMTIKTPLRLFHLFDDGQGVQDNQRQE